MTSTNKKLTDKIVTLAEKLVAAAAKADAQGGSALPKFESDANHTGYAANLDRFFMPTKKKRQFGRTMEIFASKQKYGHFGKLTTTSLSFAMRIPNARQLRRRRRPWLRPKRPRPRDGASQ